MKKEIVILAVIFMLGFSIGFVVNHVCEQEREETEEERTCAIIGDKGTYYQALGLVNSNAEQAAEICELIGSERRKDWCFQDIAMAAAKDNVTMSLSLCDMTTDVRDYCLRDVAVAHSSMDKARAAEICGEVQDDSTKNYCLALVYKSSQAKARSYCNAISVEQDRESCLSAIG